MFTIANTGKRRKCRCIKSLDIIVRNETIELFSEGTVYDCVIRDSGPLQVSYKIYGNEFDLSCTEDEFKQSFVVLEHKLPR